MALEFRFQPDPLFSYLLPLQTTNRLAIVNNTKPLVSLLSVLPLGAALVDCRSPIDAVSKFEKKDKGRKRKEDEEIPLQDHI